MIRLFMMALCTMMIVGVQAQTVTVDAENSVINWTGKKVTGQHTGDIRLSDGSLEFTDGVLSGGSFTIDMTSIKTTDLKGGMANKLDGHLKSDDFFGVETFPSAKLEITDVAVAGGAYKITADLTIKRTKAPVTFTANITPNSAKGNITIDRTVYDVKYGSGKFFDNLGDKMIYDEFELSVSLAY